MERGKLRYPCLLINELNMVEISFTSEELRDHDLLVRMDEKISQFIASQQEWTRTAQSNFQDLWQAIDGIKAELNVDKGEKSGVKWIINLLTALPAGLIGYIFGVKII